VQRKVAAPLESGLQAREPAETVPAVSEIPARTGAMKVAFAAIITDAGAASNGLLIACCVPLAATRKATVLLQ
jgi:hypothetical protein